MSFAGGPSLTAIALMTEASVGYPAFLLRAVGHPVTWIGWLIHVTETRLNRPGSPARLQKLLGAVSLIFWLAGVSACGVLVSWLCGSSYAGKLILRRISVNPTGAALAL